MARIVKIWTWDIGSRDVDMDWPGSRLAPILQMILDGGLWTEFRKFPAETVARVAPLLQLPSYTREFLDLWIEETEARER